VQAAEKYGLLNGTWREKASKLPRELLQVSLSAMWQLKEM